MTNEDMITDLKQFIAAEISHNTSRIIKKIAKIKGELKSFKVNTNDNFEEVNLRLDTVMETMGADVIELQRGQRNHERRIHRLESKAA